MGLSFPDEIVSDIFSPVLIVSEPEKMSRTRRFPSPPILAEFKRSPCLQSGEHARVLSKTLRVNAGLGTGSLPAVLFRTSELRTASAILLFGLYSLVRRSKSIARELPSRPKAPTAGFDDPVELPIGLPPALDREHDKLAVSLGSASAAHK
ncbi:hypothetical protein MVEN_02400000 [Mycena venus]|uniref:Uncharacterized protein n=1 Tax=Mycena venus TaxID=2733690 RepID=A0A8H6X2N2_9AGAR|nr:hypothetical protein MVEN_02400000 [Mycena venus]